MAPEATFVAGETSKLGAIRPRLESKSKMCEVQKLSDRTSTWRGAVVYSHVVDVVTISI